VVKVKLRRNSAVWYMLLQQNKSKMGNAVMKETSRIPIPAVFVRTAM
jgi:hypothetical protein